MLPSETIDKLIEKMKDMVSKATGKDKDLLIIYSSCHNAPVLKMKSQNDQGYLYVCAYCMEPISKIVCAVNKRLN
jgi:hypothetical protein